MLHVVVTVLSASISRNSIVIGHVHFFLHVQYFPEGQADVLPLGQGPTQPYVRQDTELQTIRGTRTRSGVVYR